MSERSYKPIYPTKCKWFELIDRFFFFIIIIRFKGIPSIHLIPTDPLFVPEINIIQGSESPVNIKLNFRNANFIGFSTVDVTRVMYVSNNFEKLNWFQKFLELKSFYLFFSGFDKDPNKSKYEIYCRIPQLAIVGQYKVNGKVIVLPVVGDGPANLTFGKFLIKNLYPKNL